MATEKIRGHLETTGPTTPEELANKTALPLPTVQQSLVAQEAEGTAMRADHLEGAAPDSWCSRRLLQRMSYLSRRQKRQSVQPASPQDFMRFLLDYHHLSPETTVRGRPGLTKVLEQLQGLDLPAGAWENQIIKKRLPDYDPLWLDELCYRGELAWLRLTPPNTPAKANSMAPRKATPITLVFREDLQWLLAAARSGQLEPPEAGPVQEIAELLESQGASFNVRPGPSHQPPARRHRKSPCGTASPSACSLPTDSPPCEPCSTATAAAPPATAPAQTSAPKPSEPGPSAHRVWAPIAP